MKIKITDSFKNILTFINSNQYYVSMKDLIQFCIDYEYYEDLYKHFHIIKVLLEEHNIDHPERKEVEDPDFSFDK